MSHQGNSIFEINQIKVSYGFKPAVEDLSLSLQKGHSLGLLGLNGAGKTSTIRALLGMIGVRAGSISILGFKPGHPKSFSKTGFAPEDGVPPEFLNGEEYLSFVGGFKIRNRAQRKKEVKDLLDWFELSPRKPIREYSKGMKRRIVLAQAFLGEPELLILDEPLNGLDPLLIIKLRERLDRYLKNGGSVLYSSHILAEIEKSCTDITILHEGKLKYQAPLDVLLKEFGTVEEAFSKQVGKN